MRNLLHAFPLLLLFGCDWDDDNDFSHQPPPGQGTIVIDNDHFNDTRVFINGEDLGKVKDDKEAFFDRPPGVYRIILDESGGDSSFAGDIDVLENRLTIVEIVSDGLDDRNSYDVAVFFD